MPTLKNYDHFKGYNRVTSTICNALAYQGHTAPHTGQAYSEALLMGISGGITLGYFYFHYEGHNPQVNLLTRNTFNNYGWDAISERLGIIQDVQHTGSADKARKNLMDALENGDAPIVWADLFSFPYAKSEFGDEMYAMMPILVYAYDEGGQAQFSDCADCGISVSAQTLDTARARIKKDKQRLITLSAPNPDKLASAVQLGIWDCIKLFTEKPPRGSANNFGFKAYQRWAQLLSKPTAKGSWAKVMPRGRDLYAGLTTAYNYGLLNEKDATQTAERHLFADFLDEAGKILDNAALPNVAEQFRKAGTCWQQLAKALLPDDVPLLKESRELMHKRHTLFLETGITQLGELHAIDDRLEELLAKSEDFPLNVAETTQLQANIADCVLAIHDAEQTAITALQDAMT